MLLNQELKRPIVIAGPCSAETEEQIMFMARALKASGKVLAMRAGIWKPRTRPNSFEGVGEKGLPWLRQAQAETGIPFMIEVANSQHVELALKYDIKHLWIGARTTVNPFTVQEIADALEGVENIEVLVKNPVNPDLNLWIGGIERIKKAGVNSVHAIHRGFSSFKTKKYRNEPMWEIPIALKTEFPDMKLICDPSHIGGARHYLAEIAQKSIDLLYDGLMIESHPNPDEALSDAQQQITPEKFIELIDNLILRSENSSNSEFKKNLDALRCEINEIDNELANLLVKRMQIVKQIGQYKGEHQISILQPQRWEEIKSGHLQIAKENGLSAEFIEKYLEIIHMESIRLQTSIMNPSNKNDEIK